MRKLIRFFSEAGALGVGGVIFALILWAIALREHFENQNIPAVWFLLGGCAAFCFGAYMAWSKADDRANNRKPKLGFSADKNGFYLTHLEGETARFITVEPLTKDNGTNVYFDQVDFLGANNKHELSPHLEIAKVPRPTDMGRIAAVMFSAGCVSYPISIKFFWNDEWLEEKVWLVWTGKERRNFFTRPRI